MDIDEEMKSLFPYDRFAGTLGSVHGRYVPQSILNSIHALRAEVGIGAFEGTQISNEDGCLFEFDFKELDGE